MKADVKSTSTAVAVKQFSTEEMDIIKNHIAKGATDSELKYFLELCRRTGLNPFTRQIYLIERRVWNPKTQQWDTIRVPQTSIDGFRSIAEDSEKYAGQVGPFWCGPDAEWHDVWVRDDYPVAARVGVNRIGFTEPLWAVAKFKEYCQQKDGKPIKMWATMPDLMIAKCAEALALRKAFPQKLGGLYTGDEMEQAEMPERQIEPPNPTAAALVDIAANAAAGATAKIVSGAVTGVGLSGGEQPYPPGDIVTTVAPPQEEMSGQAWRRFSERAIAHARAGGSFSPEQQQKMSLMKVQAPKAWQKMADAIADAQITRPEKEPEVPPQPKPGDDPDAYRLWLVNQLSTYDKLKDVNDFYDIQRPLWEPCFPPDIEDWTQLFDERRSELK